MNKIIIAVCVFNRLDNIRKWLKVWRQCDYDNVELVIIHNYYGDQAELSKFKEVCIGVTYIPRNASGFDVGAFQDVCRGRLTGFPEYDYLLWCCDDTLPVTVDFIYPFIETIEQPGVGIAAMQIAVSMAGEKHVRTTGFMIPRSVAERLTFSTDLVTTKQQCYLFEHRGPNTMTLQVRKMGLTCQQVAPNKNSPLWDVGYWKRLNRQVEFDNLFGDKLNDKVVFIVPIFEMYPQIISSLICQTHKNWELLLIHNGPCDNNLRKVITNYEDDRVKFIQYPEQTGKWGHVLRQWALKEIKDGRLSDASYVCVSNADNYVTPVFIEFLLNGFKKSHTVVATYCSDTVHSYIKWGVLPSKVELGYLDCGQVIVKKDVACEIGWNSFEHSSDWTYFSEIAARYSKNNFIKVPGALFVHN